jgi:cysteinyl-tRNA synthetase
LQAAEKGLQRLLEAHKSLQEMVFNKEETAATKSLLEVDMLEKIAQCENYINDDFNTAMVLANLFELSKTINAYKNRQIDRTELSEETIKLLQHAFTLYIETIMGLKMNTHSGNGKLEEVMQTIIRLRQNAKATKDFATSDAIRKELQLAGIQLKDEKDGTVSWSTL